MSLKTKIPLLVACMLLLNIAAITLFSRIYFLDKLAERIEMFSGREVDADMLRASDVVWELVFLEIGVIGVILLAVGAATYLLYAKPLIKLNGMVGSYKSGVIENTARNDEIGQLQNSFHRLSGKLYRRKTNAKSYHSFYIPRYQNTADLRFRA